MINSAQQMQADHSTPCFIVDLRGVVLFSGRLAHSLLAANRSVLRLQHGRLHAPGQQAKLESCLRNADLSGRSALALTRSAQLPLTLRCEVMDNEAVRSQLESDALRVFGITLRDPNLQVPDVILLQSMFALTPSEAQVTALLAKGVGTSEAARALDVQRNTVLSHIKRVLAKTGTRRQAELLAMVLRSAAMVCTEQPSRVPCPFG